MIKSKDPAFLFYPGDYLRDTQCLSEKSQVAYDRIMCEHMRNITITKERLKFFIKRLNEDEKEEIFSVLTKKNGGYQIEWVAISIEKRMAYSDSRRRNREGKKKEDMNNICKTHDSHMENETENETENKIDISEIRFQHLKNKEFESDWSAYLNGRKKKATDRAKELALMKLHKFDYDTALQMLRNSIQNGWEGIFELKGKTQQTSDNYLDQVPTL